MDTIFDYEWEPAVAIGRARCAAGGVVRVALDSMQCVKLRAECPLFDSTYFLPSGRTLIQAPGKALVEEVLFNDENHLLEAMLAVDMQALKLDWPEKRPGAKIAMLVSCPRRGGYVQAVMSGSISVGPAKGPRMPTFFIPSGHGHMAKPRPRRLRIVK